MNYHDTITNFLLDDEDYGYPDNFESEFAEDILNAEQAVKSFLSKVEVGMATALDVEEVRKHLVFLGVQV